LNQRGGRSEVGRSQLRKRFTAWVGAAIWVVATSFSTGAFAAPAATRNVAQKVYQQGTAHYKAGRYAEALAAFKASYDMVPSPNSHLMIARTQRDRGELIEAYLEYEKILPEAVEAATHDPKYAKTAETARAERDKVRAQIALVKLRVTSAPPDLEVTVATRTIDRRDWDTPVPAMPGLLAIRAESVTATAQRREVTATAGSEVEVTFDFTPPPPPPPPPPPVAVEPSAVVLPKRELPPDIPREPVYPHHGVDRTWARVFLGVGAAGLVTFVVFGALNDSTFHDLESACPNGRCPPERSDDVSKGKTQQSIANVGLGAAIVGGGISGLLFFTAAERERRENAVVTGSPAPRLTGVDVGFGNVSVRGAF
jgi:hypothetical protein